MKFSSEFDQFKAFAVKGNILDMAVGIILGLAFGKIVTSFVNDIVMPPIGLLVGGVNFTDLKVILKAATESTPEVAVKYGNFLQAVFDFLIVALSVYIMIKGMMKLKKKEAELPDKSPVATKEEVLLSEIRDLLKKQ